MLSFAAIEISAQPMGYIRSFDLTSNPSGDQVTIEYYGNDVQYYNNQVITDIRGTPYRKENTFTGSGLQFSIPISDQPDVMLIKGFAEAFAQNKAFFYNYSSRQIYTNRNFMPLQSGMGAKEIAIGSDRSVYVIGMNNVTYKYAGWGWVNIDNNNSILKITVNSDSCPWIINTPAQNLYRWNGTGWNLPSEQLPTGVTKLSELSFGANGCLYVISSIPANKLYKRWWLKGGAFVKNWTGPESQFNGTALKVATAPDSTAWVIKTNNTIYYKKNESTYGWIQVTGKTGLEIAVASCGKVLYSNQGTVTVTSAVFIIASDNMVYKYTGTSGNWTLLALPTGVFASKIAVEPGGLPWIIDNSANHYIYRYNGKQWDRM